MFVPSHGSHFYIAVPWLTSPKCIVPIKKRQNTDT